MTECAYCKAIEAKIDVVFEDDLVVSMMPKKPWIAGHVVVLPKAHYPILESVPQRTIEHMYMVANKLGIAAFNAVGAHGTTMIMNNGIGAGQRFPHVMMHIVPRKDDDGIIFSNNVQKISAQYLESARTKLIDILEENKKIDALPHPDQWIIDQLTRLP